MRPLIGIVLVTIFLIALAQTINGDRALIANSVSFSRLQQIGANTLLGNNTGSTANISALTAAQAKTLLAIAISDVSGLQAALDDKANSSHTHAAADITSGTLAAARMPAFSGDVTTTAGSTTTTIANDAVTFAKMQNISSGVLLGRSTSGTGDIETISVGTGLTLSGGTLSASGGGGGSGPTVYSNAPNSDTAINSTSNVNLVSRSIDSIAAGHTIVLEAWYTVLNNSGATATYTYRCSIGSVTVDAADSTTHATNATNRAVHYTTCKFSISSTSLTRIALLNQRSAPGAANAGLTGAQAGRYAWQSSTNNLTGTQTVALGIRSSSATATQTATLESWRITVIASNP